MLKSMLKLFGGVQHFGIVSLCLFCAVFVGVLCWAFLQRRQHLDYMSRVALDSEAELQTKGGNSHE